MLYLTQITSPKSNQQQGGAGAPVSQHLSNLKTVGYTCFLLLSYSPVIYWFVDENLASSSGFTADWIKRYLVVYTQNTVQWRRRTVFMNLRDVSIGWERMECWNGSMKFLYRKSEKHLRDVYLQILSNLPNLWLWDLNDDIQCWTFTYSNWKSKPANSQKTHDLLLTAKSLKQILFSFWSVGIFYVSVISRNRILLSE